MKIVDYLTRGWKELAIEIIVIWKKYGFLTTDFTDYTNFEVKMGLGGLICMAWAK